MLTDFKIHVVIVTLLTSTAGTAACNSEGLDAVTVPDELASRLAQQFAPVVLYPGDEPNLPASADRYLDEAHLFFYSEYCHPTQVQAGNLLNALRLHTARPSCREQGETVSVSGTRSSEKASTFYLKSPSGAERGSRDTRQWVTYCHAYRNDIGGVTLQYWRFYAYNTAMFLGIRIDSASHEGDWEAIHVVLAPGAQFVPRQVRLLGHSQIETKPWSDVIQDGGHPVITCERGSHTSHLATKSDLANRSRFIEHQGWTGGAVRWPRGGTSASGPLVMTGHKLCPEAGMEWIQYSGLWGTREPQGVFAYYRSGYWGPAFNETGMRKDGFISAWCEGIARRLNGPEKAALEHECYASRVSQ